MQVDDDDEDADGDVTEEEDEDQDEEVDEDDLVDQVAVEQGNSCGRDLKLAADRVSQSEQEVMVMKRMT